MSDNVIYHHHLKNNSEKYNIYFVLLPLTVNKTSHSWTKYRIIYSGAPDNRYSPYYIIILMK